MADDVNVVTATSACPNVRVLHLPPTARFSKNISKVWLFDSCRGSAMSARVEKLCLLESGWCPLNGGGKGLKPGRQLFGRLKARWRPRRGGEGLACIVRQISFVLLVISSSVGFCLRR